MRRAANEKPNSYISKRKGLQQQQHLNITKAAFILRSILLFNLQFTISALKVNDRRSEKPKKKPQTAPAATMQVKIMAKLRHEIWVSLAGVRQCNREIDIYLSIQVLW